MATRAEVWFHSTETITIKRIDSGHGNDDRSWIRIFADEEQVATIFSNGTGHDLPEIVYTDVTPTSIPHREIYQRLLKLYQATCELYHRPEVPLEGLEQRIAEECSNIFFQLFGKFPSSVTPETEAEAETKDAAEDAAA